LYVGPATAALEEIFADPRYFLITRSAEDAQQRVHDEWLKSLLQWIRARGVDADMVDRELTALGPSPTRAEVIVALRNGFRIHANLGSGDGAA
jgi:hypothetical protein